MCVCVVNCGIHLQQCEVCRDEWVLLWQVEPTARLRSLPVAQPFLRDLFHAVFCAIPRLLAVRLALETLASVRMNLDCNLAIQTFGIQAQMPLKIHRPNGSRQSIRWAGSCC